MSVPIVRRDRIESTVHVDDPSEGRIEWDDGSCHRVETVVVVDQSVVRVIVSRARLTCSTVP